MKPVTLVFIHYFGGSKESWNWVIALLEKDFHCIALNLPGFGGSSLEEHPSLIDMADYVTQQIKALSTENCVLIGHSMGGKVAVQVAIQNTENDLLSQLILIAPSPPSVEEMPDEQRKVLRELQDEAQVIKNVDDAIIKELGVIQYQMALKTQREIQVTARRWWIDEGISESIAQGSKSLSLPITVIASKTDPAITYEMTSTETMPNIPLSTKLIETTGVGHLIPLEDPAWLAGKIIDTIKKAGI